MSAPAVVLEPVVDHIVDLDHLEQCTWEADESEERLGEAIRALIRIARAAARVNELVGTETEEGQDVAWEELDAALAAVHIDQNDDGRDT